MVVDASAAVAWSLPSQRTQSAIDLVEKAHGTFTAPWYFAIEFRNVMLKAERRGLITRETGEASVTDTMQLVALAPPPSLASLEEIQRLARREGLSHYDGHYLDMALSRGLPLATRDGALIKAARVCGLDVHDLRQ